jgi:hypothetical protein
MEWPSFSNMIPLPKFTIIRSKVKVSNTAAHFFLIEQVFSEQDNSRQDK